MSRRPITALLMIGDGRDDYHHASRVSALANLPHTDHYIDVQDADHALGFGGAIREAWRRVRETDADWIFHLELDFTFTRLVPLAAMIEALRLCPHLAQMALLRQPVNEQEQAAGSIYNLIRAELTPRSFAPAHWLEHTRNFTTNPSVYPRWVTERDWPDEAESEGKFGAYLLRDRPETRFAYWGSGEEWCTHIGHQRTGTGY